MEYNIRDTDYKYRNYNFNCAFNEWLHELSIRSEGIIDEEYFQIEDNLEEILNDYKKQKRIINQFLKEYTPTMKRWYGDYSIQSMTYKFLKIWEMPEEVIDEIISTKIPVCKKKYYNVNGFPDYYLTSVLYLLNHYDYFNFERFKTCINNYIEISKKCREIDGEYPCAEDQYLPEDSGFELLGKYSKLLNSEQIKEIEKIIEDNISEFIGYEAYNYKWDSQMETDNLAFMTPLQEYFLFYA